MNIDAMKRRRIAIKATLEDVAVAAGVRAATVSRWERGVINPHIVMARAWERALDILERRAKATA